MAIQTFLSQSTSDNCVKAVAPEVTQAFLDIAELTGDVAQDLLAQIAPGAAAAHSGTIVNSGCMDLELTISYVDGADCDTCSTDTLSEVAVTYFVKKNRQVSLPVGLVSRIQVQTGNLDAAGAFTAAAVPANQTQQVEFDSCYQPCCGVSAVVPTP